MTAPSLLILGTDAVLAATPATAVQLVHACRAAGYDAVIPATWGDELIAARALDRLRVSETPLIQCSCPLVARRLAAQGFPIAPMLLSLVAPPVAAALYLRAMYAPTRIVITFAGGCAAAGDDVVDVWLSTDALMADLVDRGIPLRTQPTEFDSVLPPDRRRFFSEPGGVPSPAALRQLSSPVDFLELGANDLVTELAQRLLTSSRTLIDIAPVLGCTCSGAAGNTRPENARARIRELEPPRALAPVVDHAVALALDCLGYGPSEPVELTRRSSTLAPRSPPAPPPSDLPSVGTPPSTPLEAAPESVPVAVEALQRRSPQGLSRPVLGSMPHARTDAGRHLPRAYVARRRSSPRELRAIRSSQSAPAKERRRRQVNWVAIAAAALAAGLIISWLLFAS